MYHNNYFSIILPIYGLFSAYSNVARKGGVVVYHNNYFSIILPIYGLFSAREL